MTPIHQTVDGTSPDAMGTAWRLRQVCLLGSGQECKSVIMLFHYAVPSAENYISDRRPWLENFNAVGCAQGGSNYRG